MEFIGTLITYLMMACCVVGGISYIVNDYCAIIGLNQKDLENQGILA